LAIYFNTVSGDESRFFHAVDTLDDGRGRKANPPAKFRKVNARVVLELGQNAPSDGVEELGNF
jgi:hypothetical protein